MAEAGLAALMLEEGVLHKTASFSTGVLATHLDLGAWLFAGAFLLRRRRPHGYASG
jgi:hypothetical protein